MARAAITPGNRVGRVFALLAPAAQQTTQDERLVSGEMSKQGCWPATKAQREQQVNCFPLASLLDVFLGVQVTDVVVALSGPATQGSPAPGAFPMQQAWHQTKQPWPHRDLASALITSECGFASEGCTCECQQEKLWGQPGPADSCWRRLLGRGAWA